MFRKTGDNVISCHNETKTKEQNCLIANKTTFLFTKKQSQKPYMHINFYRFLVRFNHFNDRLNLKWQSNFII